MKINEKKKFLEKFEHNVQGIRILRDKQMYIL